MRRRLNPWAVVITAALTFGSLMAFVGPRSFGYHRGHWSHGRGYYRGYDDNRSGLCDDAGPHTRSLLPRSDSTEAR